jgi:hypothetical protein
VLATYERVTGQGAPESWVLCVRGQSFELGAPLGESSVAHLSAAWPPLLRLCQLS